MSIVEVKKFLKDTSGTILENNQVQALTHLQIKLTTSYQGLKFTITIWETWTDYVQNIPLLPTRKKYLTAMSVLVKLVMQRITALLNGNRSHVTGSHLSERSGIGVLRKCQNLPRIYIPGLPREMTQQNTPAETSWSTVIASQKIFCASMVR